MQVRYLQLRGVEIAAAVAAGAILANVANVVVQGALFLVVLGFTSPELDTSKIDVDHIAGILRTVVLLAGIVVAVAYGFPRFRERTLPPTKPRGPRSGPHYGHRARSCCSSRETCAPRSCRRCACSRA